MTDEEIQDQIKKLEVQLRGLKTAAKENKEARRGILPKEIAAKYADEGWDGKYYAIGKLLSYRELTQISSIIRGAMGLSDLSKIGDTAYREYADHLDKMLSVIKDCVSNRL